VPQQNPYQGGISQQSAPQQNPYQVEITQQPVPQPVQQPVPGQPNVQPTPQQSPQMPNPFARQSFGGYQTPGTNSQQGGQQNQTPNAGTIPINSNGNNRTPPGF
jgi:hypothetical protein